MHEKRIIKKMINNDNDIFKKGMGTPPAHAHTLYCLLIVECLSYQN